MSEFSIWTADKYRIYFVTNNLSQIYLKRDPNSIDYWRRISIFVQ